MTLLSRIKNSYFGQIACAVLMVLCAVLISMGESSQAYADSTFLLQLGSFSSEAQATGKWDEIKSKNADLVGKLSLHVAEVALPPDNAISYRTQAGPIGSHDQAATICSNLQKRGVDCNVVETALFTAADVAPAATAQVPQAPALLAATAPPALTVPPVSQAAAPVPLMPEPQPMPVAAMPVTAMPPAESGDVPASHPAQPVTVSGYVAGQEPKFLDAVVSSPATPSPAYPSPAPAPVTFPAPVASAAVVTEPSAQSANAASSAPPSPPAHGFLYRMIHGAPEAVAPVASTAALPAANPNPNPVGQVSVSEAIRVPLSSGMPKNQAVVAHLPAVHGLGGSPSVNTSKSLWAQISYFADEAAARDFYDDFAASYPQFSEGVRVRVTRPYLNSSEAGRVSLRVGPFASANAVNTICTAAAARKVGCALVRDIGTSTAAGIARGRTLDHSYEAPAPSVSAEEPLKYWVQLGSFRSSSAAWDEWQNLQEGQRKLLGNLTATVTTPPVSSSVHVQYRLRAGPFINESAADSLCDALSGIGASNCVVVNDR